MATTEASEGVYISRKRRAVARRILRDSLGYAEQMGHDQMMTLMDNLGQRLSPITDSEKEEARRRAETIPGNGILYPVQA